MIFSGYNEGRKVASPCEQGTFKRKPFSQRLLKRRMIKMNKPDLIAAVAAEAEITKVDSERFLSAFEKVVTQAFVNGEKVLWKGFFSAEVIERAEREGHNPQTGEPITIPAHTTAKFRTGKRIRDALNSN